MQGSAKTVLTDQMLARFAERGARYDRENLFFQEDFDELKAAGYFKQCVPRELGGAGLTLAEYCQDLRRLAYHAPATALATNMHQYWVGLVADLWRAGDKSLEWLLTETLAGEIFAAGHAETGNDIPVLLSTTKAERTQGGYKFTGRKSFGSMTPVWTRLGIHGMDTTDPANPRVVHAFLPRDAEGFRVEKTWDHVLGMRATRSDDTILQGAVVPEKYVARVVAPGAAGVDGFVLGIFAWALVGFGNVYYAMARRAFDLTVDRVKSKTSVAVTRSMAYHPAVQHEVAQMAMELEAIEPHLDRIAKDWSEGVNHGGTWPLKIVSAKYRAVEGAFRVIDRALDVSGGYGAMPASGLERLFRDARMGRFHPANFALTTELVAKTALGINPDESPRWG